MPRRYVFIPAQRLFRLEAPPERRRDCLRPETFRACRQQLSEQNNTRSMSVGSEDGCQWLEVLDRRAFLGDLSRKRLCLTVDAGVGKTTALKQAAFVRQRQDPGHLAVYVRFGELPKSSEDYLDTEDATPELVCWLKNTPATKHMPAKLAVSFIRQQIRSGRFSLLVDALDQSARARDPEACVRGLVAFLRRYPEVRCVVSGRPYSIQHYWNVLFQPEGRTCPWEFAQIDVFTEQEVTQFVGDERKERLGQLGADTLMIPRMLETVLDIPVDGLDRVRTASDIYWRSLQATLEQAFTDQEAEIDLPEAEKLFSLLAFEMTARANFDGVRPGKEYDTFLREVWNSRRDQLAHEDDVGSKNDFKYRLTQLARLNENIDFAVLDHHGLTQIYWRNPTLQAVFSALWITRYATLDDRKWLRRHVFIRADEDTQNRYEMWKLATEMPGKSPGEQREARDDQCYVKTMSVLYFPHRQPEKALRSTEIIYRSWPAMLRLAGYLTKPNWLEWDVEAATQCAQREVGELVDSGANCRDRQNPARNAILRFLGEFPSILKGKGSDHAERIGAEFEIGFRRIPADPDDALGFWVSAEQARGEGGQTQPSSIAGAFQLAQPSSIAGAFQLAQYPVTNELYALFDAKHSQRSRPYGDYGKLSSEPRCPAIYVDWYDAWCIATWLGGRLPSEHEWEYACRAQPGTQEEATLWWFGNKEADLEHHAWYRENSGLQAHPVGHADHANGFGLSDMHGLVWEWTSSWYHEDAEAGRDPTYTGSSRVLRGGSFHYFAILTRSAFRHWYHPARAHHYDGVRVARALPENLRPFSP